MLATLSFFNLGVLKKYRCNPTPVTVLSIESPMRVFCITFLKAFTDPLPELSLEPVTDSPCLSNPSLI